MICYNLRFFFHNEQGRKVPKDENLIKEIKSMTKSAFEAYR